MANGTEQRESDHDILLEVRRDVAWLKQAVNNHLHEHTAQTKQLWSLFAAIIAAFIAASSMLVIRIVT